MESLFVSIISADGKNDMAIACSTDRECTTVIEREAKRRGAHTMFFVIGEDRDGRPVPIDRWGVSSDGRLVHAPYRSKQRSMHTMTTRAAR